MAQSHIDVHGTVECASLVSHYLHNYDSLCSGDDASTKETLGADASSLAAVSSLHLTVDNKYFTAKVGLSVYNSAASVAPSNSKAEALVVAMSLLEAAAFRLHEDTDVASLLSASATQHLSADDIPAYAVQLLVTVADVASGEGEAPALAELLPQAAREALVGWCCANNFELVELDAASAQTLCATHDEREKEGLPRLVEALSSHMWSSAVNKSQPRKGGAGGASYSSTQPAPTVGEVGPEVATATAAAAAAATAENKDKKEKGEVKPTAAESSESGNPFLPADPSLEEDANDPDTAVFTLLNQARSVREAVEKGNMSDSDRRDAAAQMAMRFASMMNLQGESGSDSD